MFQVVACCQRFMQCILAFLSIVGVASAQNTFDDPFSSNWVAEDGEGHLHYRTTDKGDRIVDFSHAGYGGGGIAIPTVPVQKEVDPSGGDDVPVIQAAIDFVATLPLKDGSRGAVLLAPGTFHCSDQITISTDGIVLRGSGSGEHGTLIKMIGSPHVCVVIKGKFAQKTGPASVTDITDDYVPAGALGFSVKDAANLRVGDAIYVRKPVTEAWIHLLGMDKLVRNGKPQVWMNPKGSLNYERTIDAIHGNRITLDVPLTDAIDSRLITPEVPTIIKIVKTKERLSQCGIESLKIVSPPPSGTLTAKNNGCVNLGDCEDCWVRDVAMIDALGNVGVYGARRITLEEIHTVHRATVEKGAGYPADFFIRGTQVLINRCSSQGDGSFYVATAGAEAMLNVALNCDFQGNGSVQPHMHWSTALLIDCCKIPDGRIELINRGTSGSGHGWAMGWGVAWNCAAKFYSIDQPPGAINWCIGCSGILRIDKKHEAVLKGPQGNPHSLYLAQLRERLGEDALKNIGY